MILSAICPQLCNSMWPQHTLQQITAMVHSGQNLTYTKLNFRPSLISLTLLCIHTSKFKLLVHSYRNDLTLYVVLLHAYFNGRALDSLSQGCNFELCVRHALCPSARHFTLTCSSRPRCINGYWLRLRWLQASCTGLVTLSKEHYILSGLVQLQGKNEMGFSGCTEKCPHQLPFTFVRRIKITRESNKISKFLKERMASGSYVKPCSYSSIYFIEENWSHLCSSSSFRWFRQ